MSACKRKIYFAADTAKSKPEADLLDLILQNRDIVFCILFVISLL